MPFQRVVATTIFLLSNKAFTVTFSYVSILSSPIFTIISLNNFSLVFPLLTLLYSFLFLPISQILMYYNLFFLLSPIISYNMSKFSTTKTLPFLHHFLPISSFPLFSFFQSFPLLFCFSFHHYSYLFNSSLFIFFFFFSFFFPHISFFLSTFLLLSYFFYNVYLNLLLFHTIV